MTNAPAAAAPAGAPQKPWLAHYPPGVPAEIDEGSLGTLVDLFRETVARFSERTAVESFGVRQNYAELGRQAGAVAGWLQAQGFGKGERVAIMLPNVMAYPAILFGVLAAGCTVVNVNPLYTARELSHQLRDSGARALFVLENFGHTVAEAWPEAGLGQAVIVTPGDLLGLKGALVNLVSRHVKKAVKPFSLPASIPFRQVLAEGRRAPGKRAAIGPEDVAFLQYTGGTTGVAKGATLTHRNVAANVEQCRLWFASVAGGENVMVTALPLYHIFALTCFFFMLRIGANSLLIANPRDIAGFVKTLAKTRFTMMQGVNTLFNALANHPEIGKVDFSRVKFCVAGGMAVQSAVAQRWKALTGCPIVEGYGLSETSPVVCVNRPDIAAFTGTIGYPVPSTEVSIRAEDGSVLPLGEAGELCVRGPQVMRGYWNRPDETAKVNTADGFFRTGDVAVLLPDGQVKIVDRIKDMILVSGFNVYPNEVEDVLASHPGVLEACVIGVPDPQSGEAVKAFVVRKDQSLTADALRAFARENLTPYKVPRHVEFRDALPKTPVGKVLRRELRDAGGAG